MAYIEHQEPPDRCDLPYQPSSKSPLFFIGRDSRGNRVVRDQAGLCGGLFVNRCEAVRFAKENGCRAIITVPQILELTADFWPHDFAGRQTPPGFTAAAHCGPRLKS